MTRHVIEIVSDRWYDRGPTYPRAERWSRLLVVRSWEKPAQEVWPADSRELIATPPNWLEAWT